MRDHDVSFAAEIQDTSFVPEWGPLEKHVGKDRCRNFMFMAVHATSGNKRIHAYKHRDTRRYLNIDQDGSYYRFDGTQYQMIPARAALAHALLMQN